MGRPSREEEIRRNRRRSDYSGYTPKRLQADIDKLNAGETTEYVYRWANDKQDRVQHLYGQDWDVVSDRAGGIAENDDAPGTAVGVTTGGTGGSPEFRAVLMRKPRVLHDDDQEAKMRRLEKKEQAIEAGADEQVNSPYQYVPSDRKPRVVRPRG